MSSNLSKYSNSKYKSKYLEYKNKYLFEKYEYENAINLNLNLNLKQSNTLTKTPPTYANVIIDNISDDISDVDSNKISQAKKTSLNNTVVKTLSDVKISQTDKTNLSTESQKSKVIPNKINLDNINFESGTQIVSKQNTPKISYNLKDILPNIDISENEFSDNIKNKLSNNTNTLAQINSLEDSNENGIILKKLKKEPKKKSKKSSKKSSKKEPKKSSKKNSKKASKKKSKKISKKVSKKSSPLKNQINNDKIDLNKISKKNIKK
jgi:hypothetical protein